MSLPWAAFAAGFAVGTWTTILFGCAMYCWVEQHGTDGGEGR